MNKRKKIKCEKCEIRYFDRGPEDAKTGSGFVRELCWNCGFLWKMTGLVLQAMEMYGEKLNRDLRITLENVEIRKKP